MVTKKEVLRLLAEHEIPAVLIGGLALRVYNSPRTTPDMDLAIRSLDVDRVVELMYERGFSLISSIGGTHATVLPRAAEALRWAESGETRSLTFVRTVSPGLGGRIALRDLDLSAEVDFYFDLAVPVMRLKERAREFLVDGFPVLVAAPEDLLELKRQREDKTAADLADIAFLERLVSRHARS